MNRNLFLLPFAACLSLLFSCNPVGDAAHEGEYIPAAPDYSEETFWYKQENDTDGDGADVFYLVSTWEADWYTDDSLPCHYADVHNPGHRERMSREISGVAGYMADGNNFYSPYYRHMTIDIWETQNEDTINSRFRLPFDDVKKSFDYYMRNFNNGRPFVLAGFSQGAKAVVELMKTMDNETAGKMVAAYVMGYKVTPSDTVSCPVIKGARACDDTGVTVCYNSVSSAEHIPAVVAKPCAMCINPVNWRTDATPAILHDTIKVSVDTDNHVLLLDGYSGSEYAPIRGFLNVGDFHSAEPWLYSDHIGANIKQRVESFRSTR